MAESLPKNTVQSHKTFLKLVAAVIVTVIAINLLVMDYLILADRSSKNKSKDSLTPVAPISTASAYDNSQTPSSGCDQKCQEIIDKKIGELREELKKPTQTTIIKNVPVPSSGHGEKTVYFGGSGSTRETDWVDVVDTTITFKPADFPSAKQLKFVATLRSDAPDRKAYARIYNISDKIEIWQSEISYAGLANKTIESQTFGLPGVNVNLKIQIKSFLLNTSYIENAQLKIIY